MVASNNDEADASSSLLAQRVIRQVVLNQTLQNQRSVSSMNTSSSQNNRKVVSFSTISAPSLYPGSGEGEEMGLDALDDAGSEQHMSSSGRPASPPPILSGSPPTRFHNIQDTTVQFETNFSSNTDADAVSALSGEPTFSGNSSIASTSDTRCRSAGSVSSGTKQVVFSAINPNPHLALRTEDDDDNEYEDQHRVTFTIDQTAENWNDDGRGTQGSSAGGSRGSRSGLSSPSIEPPASPPRSRSSSLGVSIADAAIEVITEAAARLQSQNEDDTNKHTHRVHFSAMKEFVKSESLGDSFSDEVAVDGSNEDGNHAHVHFADQGNSEESSKDLKHEYSYTEDEMKSVADRLRRVIRRAEKLGNLTLEDAFAQLDTDHSGSVSAEELQANLRRLGSSFEFTLEECSALMACLTGHHSNEEMNLLSFYRAMGRRSPPPMSASEQANVDHMDLSESPAVHADNAANRLRKYILTLEQTESDLGIESTFHQLDADNSGYITADEFHEGLRTLGSNDDNFPSLDDEDCEELVQIFDANKDGKVSLIDFYRFMGRRSPPLARPSLVDDQVVKKAEDEEYEVDPEHDHFRDFLAKKKRDDEDEDPNDACPGGNPNLSNLSSSKTATSSSTQQESNKSSDDSNDQSSKSGDGSCVTCMFTASPQPSDTVEVIMQRPTAHSGVLPYLLSENKHNLVQDSLPCHADGLMMSRDDSDVLGLQSMQDCHRIGQSAFQKINIKNVDKKVEGVSSMLQLAMDHIEIDSERSSPSPVPVGRPMSNITPRTEFAPTSAETKPAIHVSCQGSITPSPEVELRYDEDHREVSVVQDGNKIQMSM